MTSAPGSAPEAKGLLISVGGTAAPVAFAIHRHRPEKVIFFASQQSRAEIETKIRPLAGHAWSDHEVITASDPEDLTRCMETLTRALPEHRSRPTDAGSSVA